MSKQCVELKRKKQIFPKQKKKKYQKILFNLLFPTILKEQGTMSTEPTNVDLNSLPPQKLVEFRKSIDEEITHFTQSLQALAAAQSKLKDCISSINNLEQSKEDNLLVPLTSSLYIPGQVVTRNRYLVDIGTGYYVEKLAKKAKLGYDKKIKKLDEDAKKLKGILVQKNELLNTVNLILRKKVIEMEKQQEGSSSADATN